MGRLKGKAGGRPSGRARAPRQLKLALGGGAPAPAPDPAAAGTGRQPVLIHRSVRETLASMPSLGGLRFRAHHLLRRLLAHGPAGLGRAAGSPPGPWQLGPVGVAGGAVVELGWALAGTLSLQDPRIAPDTILVRTLAKASFPFAPPDPGDPERDYVPLRPSQLAAGEVPYGPALLDVQAIAASDPHDRRLIYGPPGSGKTVVLLVAAGRGPIADSLFVVDRADRIEPLARELRTFGKPGVDCRFVSYVELYGALAPEAAGAVEPDAAWDFWRAAARFEEVLTGTGRVTPGPWRNRWPDLYAELYAHWAGADPLSAAGLLSGPARSRAETYAAGRRELLGPEAAEAAAAAGETIAALKLEPVLFPRLARARAAWRRVSSAAELPVDLAGRGALYLDDAQELTALERRVLRAMAEKMNGGRGAQLTAAIDAMVCLRPAGTAVPDVFEPGGRARARVRLHRFPLLFRSSMMTRQALISTREETLAFLRGRRAEADWDTFHSPLAGHIIRVAMPPGEPLEPLVAAFAATPGAVLLRVGAGGPAGPADRGSAARVPPSPSEAGGPEFRIVGLVYSGAELRAAQEAAVSPPDESRPRVSAGHELLSEFRLAMSLSTEALVFIELAGAGKTAPSFEECFWGLRLASELTPAELVPCLPLLASDTDTSLAQVEHAGWAALGQAPETTLRLAGAALHLLAFGVPFYPRNTPTVRRLYRMLGAGLLASSAAGRPEPRWVQAPGETLDAARALQLGGLRATATAARSAGLLWNRGPIAWPAEKTAAGRLLKAVQEARSHPALAEFLSGRLREWLTAAAVIRPLPAMSQPARDFEELVRRFEKPLESRHPEVKGLAREVHARRLRQALEAGNRRQACGLAGGRWKAEPLVQAVFLEQAGRPEEAARLLEQAGEPAAALRAWRRAGHWPEAATLAAGIDPAQVPVLDWLVRLSRQLAALDPERARPLTAEEKAGLRARLPALDAAPERPAPPEPAPRAGRGRRPRSGNRRGR